MKKRFNLFVGVLLMVLVLFSLIDAVAVSGRYTVGNPLMMGVGGEKEIVLFLQNMAGEGDVKFKAVLVDSHGIVELVDNGLNDEYLVPLGVSNVSVKLKVEIPDDVKIGKSYNIGINFEPIALGGEGEMIQMVMGLSRNFVVGVTGEEEIEVVELNDVELTPEEVPFEGKEKEKGGELEGGLNEVKEGIGRIFFILLLIVLGLIVFGVVVVLYVRIRGRRDFVKSENEFVRLDKFGRGGY